MQPFSRRPPAFSAALGMALLTIGLYAANPSEQSALLADLKAFEAERSAFRRLLPGEQGMTADAVSAYYRALFNASAVWVQRWPRREFAWRARLEALLGLVDQEPVAAREAALLGVETSRRIGPLAYPEPLELLAARVLVRHRVELPLARDLAAQALQSKMDFFDRLELARPGESFDGRRRRWRWRTALVSIEAAEAERDQDAWRTALDELDGAAAPKPCASELKPSERGSCNTGTLADPRQEAVEYAAGQLELHRRRARFFSAGGHDGEALDALLRAVELRPAFRSKVEPPANQAVLDEACAAWLAAGRSEAAWAAWIERRKGYPIPTLMR